MALKTSLSITFINSLGHEFIYRQGMSALAKQDFQHAYRCFYHLINNLEHDYDIADLLLKCGIAAAKTGDVTIADRYLKQSFRLNPSEEKLGYLMELAPVNT